MGCVIPSDAAAADTVGGQGPLDIELIFSGVVVVVEDDGGDGLIGSPGFFLKFFFIIS